MTRRPPDDPPADPPPDPPVDPPADPPADPPPPPAAEFDWERFGRTIDERLAAGVGSIAEAVRGILPTPPPPPPEDPPNDPPKPRGRARIRSWWFYR